jgi:hypothetical protein
LRLSHKRQVLLRETDIFMDLMAASGRAPALVCRIFVLSSNIEGGVAECNPHRAEAAEIAAKQRKECKWCGMQRVNSCPGVPFQSSMVWHRAEAVERAGCPSLPAKQPPEATVSMRG